MREFCIACSLAASQAWTCRARLGQCQSGFQPQSHVVMQPHMVSGYFAVMTSLLLRTQQPPQGIFGPNTLRAKMNRFAAALEQLAINRHITHNPGSDCHPLLTLT